MKKMVSVLLAVLLLLTAALPLQAWAEPVERHNGPLTAEVSDDPFAVSFTGLNLIELNADGTSKEDANGDSVYFILFRNEWDEKTSSWYTKQDKLPAGVAYDLKTNTVTLTNFNGANYRLFANMMGDDLTIRVKGACSLAQITIWGDGWGAGLHLTGDGSLTVNEKKLFDNAIEFHPEGVDLTFGIDKATTVKLSAKKDAVAILGTQQTENIFDLPDGVKTEPKKETYVQHKNKRIFGYTINENYFYTMDQPKGVSKDDPDGIYSVSEVTYYPDGVDKPGIPRIDVTHYYYSEKYDFYLEDHDFGDELGHSERVFDDLEAAKAAGFEQIKDENDNLVWLEMRMCGASGNNDVVIGPDGREYAAAWTKKPDGSYGDALAEIEELPGEEDKYLFVIRQDLYDVDTDKLTRVTVDESYDGVYTWKLPGTAFSYEGSGGEQPPATGGVRGDADLDGKVLAKDARLVLRASARLETLTGQAFANCDLDGNGKLLASEARMILRFSAKLEKEI